MDVVRVECKGSGLIDISDIKPFQGKLKELSTENYEKLKKQILIQGFSAPFFIWDKTSECLDGHQRHNALLKMRTEGIEVPKLPCVHIFAKSRKEAKQKLLSFASQYGKMSKDGLYEFMHEAGIEFKDVKSDFTFPEIDFDKFEKEFYDKTEDVEGQDEIPVSRETSIQLGDLFQLGSHRLLCGDSTDANMVQRLMNGEKADITFTSPPYNVGAVPGGSDRHKKYINWEQDAKSEDEYEIFLSKALSNSMLVSQTQWINLQLLEGGKRSILKWLARFSDHFLDNMVWVKNNANPTPRCTITQFHEHIFIFNSDKKPNKAIPGMDFDFAKSVILVNPNYASQEADIHRAGFSIELVLKVFAIALKLNGAVFEPFCGLGSTLIACEKTERKCFGMEIDPQYCQVIIDRWEKFTGKKSIKYNEKELTKSTINLRKKNGAR
jgi:DNA modification methylase